MPWLRVKPEGMLCTRTLTAVVPVIVMLSGAFVSSVPATANVSELTRMVAIERVEPAPPFVWKLPPETSRMMPFMVNTPSPVMRVR